MIIVLRPDATKKQLDHLVLKIKKLGLRPWISKGVERTIVGVIGEEDVMRTQPLEVFPGVEKVMQILTPYKLASRDFKREGSVVDISPDVKIGGKKLVIMAGPCSVESQKLLINIARKVKKAGAVVLRG
ncbi:MAG: 3-deoxy-7-phosphoheptulonate synthase, partial [Candidatus Omnitrophica bacterium]|nr:3-deoxy-7-phosphoheptulonate synthase [Candidatus Omnitrophota bacterium]